MPFMSIVVSAAATESHANRTSEGDDDIARSLDVLQGVVATANSLVDYLLASEEVAKKKLREAHASADNKEDSQS